MAGFFQKNGTSGRKRKTKKNGRPSIQKAIVTASDPKKRIRLISQSFMKSSPCYNRAGTGINSEFLPAFVLPFFSFIRSIHPASQSP
jgi:hypothetical protein